jgi:hypothetical protein
LDVGGGFAEEVEVLDDAALEGEDADGDVSCHAWFSWLDVRDPGLL